MKIALIILAMTLLGSALAADATDPPKTAVQASDMAAARNLDMLVCKRQSSAGTHFKKKVCMTERQWRLQAEETQASFQYESDRFQARQSETGF